MPSRSSLTCSGRSTWSVAEDAVQDALLRARCRPGLVGGVPAQPAAWLFTVASNWALDRLRRDTCGFANVRGIITAAVPGAAGRAEPRRGDGCRSATSDLCVMFPCCHPALSRDARVALTLTRCPADDTEIARAFFGPRRRWRSASSGRNAGSATGFPVRFPPDDLVPASARGPRGALPRVQRGVRGDTTVTHDRARRL